MKYIFVVIEIKLVSTVIQRRRAVIITVVLVAIKSSSLVFASNWQHFHSIFCAMPFGGGVGVMWVIVINMYRQQIFGSRWRRIAASLFSTRDIGSIYISHSVWPCDRVWFRGGFGKCERVPIQIKKGNLSYHDNTYYTCITV